MCIILVCRDAELDQGKVKKVRKKKTEEEEAEAAARGNVFQELVSSKLHKAQQTREKKGKKRHRKRAIED